MKTSPAQVKEVMEACGLAESRASRELRALQSRGLLLAERIGRNVLYHLRTDPLVPQAVPMLAALVAAIERGDPLASRLFALTAFTHPRRILIVRALAQRPSAPLALAAACQISPPALSRHLAKLVRRRVVEAEETVLHLNSALTGYPRDLLDLALVDPGRVG